MDWEALYEKRIDPPYVPTVKAAEDVANIDEEFLNEAPVETLQEDSALLRAHRDNEAFDNFSFVNQGIIDEINVRATAMEIVGNSFMDFQNSNDGDARLYKTVVDTKKQQAGYNGKKDNTPGTFEKADLYYTDESVGQSSDRLSPEHDQGGGQTSVTKKPVIKRASQQTSQT